MSADLEQFNVNTDIPSTRLGNAVVHTLYYLLSRPRLAQKRQCEGGGQEEGFLSLLEHAQGVPSLSRDVMIS